MNKSPDLTDLSPTQAEALDQTEAQRQADLFIPMTQQEKAKDSAGNYELAIEELRKR